MKNYKCNICGKTNVKIWRPYGDSKPLICAECAEKRQTPQEYQERSWKKDEIGEGYTGTFTKRILPLPKWKVNENGKVPGYQGPGPKGLPPVLTDQLIVDLSDISTSYTSGDTTMIPACPDDHGDFFGYTEVPESVCKWWKSLPTR